MARYYFTRGARFVWAKDHPNKPSWGRRDPNKAKATKTDKKSKEQQKDYEKEVYAARCAGYLGRMFLRGEGVRQDIRLARMWFERGAEVNDHESLNGLGMMYRDGLIDDPKDTAKDAKDSPKAAEYFNLASAQELADAQLNMGKLLYDKGEVGLAIQWFEAAVRSGSPLEAYYLIADIHAENARGNLAPESSVQVSMTTAGSCSIATSFYKVVAERASWDEELVREGNAFWNAATQENVSAAEVERHKMEAMLRWLIAAEMGIEVAQNNVAFLLDSGMFSCKWRCAYVPHVTYR
jgi:SEL1 protein